MEKKPNSNIQLPPGFRFHPTDEELIVYYLRNKATSITLPASIMAEVDLYKCNPWDLPRKALFGEEEWYFFTPRDRKYPNGTRPNRMAASGYWKATGTDKPILDSCQGKTIGVKKALVFYHGRPPRGVKTDWIMHEYRLPEPTSTSKQKGCMRLDDWVLCRVRQKSSLARNGVEDQHGSSNEQFAYSQNVEKLCPTSMHPNLEIVTDFLYRDCLVLPLIIGSQDLPSLDTVSSISLEAGRTSNSVGQDYSDTNHSQYSVPPFDGSITGRKRKPMEGQQNGVFIPPKKVATEGDDIWNNERTELNFHGTEQSKENNFDLDHWNSITQYEEFNHLTSTEERSK
ncbi:hypothetical protein NMG60_11005493 [Bertholletia excelsa]